MAGAGYVAWYMWQQSEKPLPQPAGEALSKAVNVGGAKMQQAQEQGARGTYPGAANAPPQQR